MAKKTPNTTKSENAEPKIQPAAMALDSKAAVILTTPVESWTKLADLIEKYGRDTSAAWLFRGVTNTDYTLRPRIGRENMISLGS